MFICDTCLKKHYQNPQSFVVQFGECEWCKESHKVNDIPLSVLIPKHEPKKIADSNNVYIQRFTKEDVNPKAGGIYFTDLGRLTFHVKSNGWMKYSDLNAETIGQPEWWLELMPESKYLEGILPHESVDETFIEHEINYQHHGTSRMVINKYKKFILEKLNDKK